MRKIAVVYKSKYGTTERYAKWIAEDVGASIFKSDKVKVNQLKEYDVIVYCGGLYAGGILGFNVIKRNYSMLSDKRLIVVAVGKKKKKEDELEGVKNHHLTDEIKGKVEFFMLRGGLNYKKMSWLDRFLMFMLVKTLKGKKPEELDDDAKGIIATYGKVVDFCNRDTIEPILEAINK